MQPMPNTDRMIDFSFPRAGIDQSTAFVRQKPRQLVGKSGTVQEQISTGQTEIDGYDVQAKPDPLKWGRTTPAGINVRGFEPSSNRARGGARSGLSKHLPRTLIGKNIVQNINFTVGSSVQTSTSGRVVTVVAVAQGRVFYANAGDTVWTEAVNQATTTPALNFTGIVRSSVNNQTVFFCDGVHLRQFSPSTGIVEDWQQDSQDLLGNPITTILPIDSMGNVPLLTCTWRGRTVLSGLLLDPQDWFMSAVSQPGNWDYSPIYTTPTQAIAGNNSPLGLVGDVITSLVPYNDDVLIFGGDHTLWMMNGDPMAGGQIDRISDAIGMAFGIPWCKDPYGNVYFFSNRTGIYTLQPGQTPQRISQPIESLVNNIDTGQNTVTAVWNDRFQQVHFFITPTGRVQEEAIPVVRTGDPVTHLCYEQRTGSWWQDRFANPNHNPLCCINFDGNTAGDRVPLIGSWDGYVRALDPETTEDDGWPIASSVILGPLLTQDMDEVMLHELQAVLGETSDEIQYKVFAGQTAEQALSNEPIAEGHWEPGRNVSDYVRRAGHAIYIELSSSNPWSMEMIRCRVAGLGKVRQRSRY